MMRSSSEDKSLDDWYEKRLGQDFLACELALLETIFKKLYGYYWIQPSSPQHFLACELKNFVRRITIEEPHPMIACQKPVVWGEEGALPILSNTMDLAVLPHILEFSTDPQHLLQEYYRVLKPDGYLVILGFNPISLLGLQRLIFRNPPFAKKKLMTSYKVVGELKKLSCRIESIEPYGLSWCGLNGYAPWFAKQFEHYAKKICPVGCSAYLIVAQKKVIPFTLIKSRWQKQTVLPSKFLKPSTQCEKAEDFL
jgi:SAM-dependent methyltransferase